MFEWKELDPTMTLHHQSQWPNTTFHLGCTFPFRTNETKAKGWPFIIRSHFSLVGWTFLHLKNKWKENEGLAFHNPIPFYFPRRLPWNPPTTGTYLTFVIFSHLAQFFSTQKRVNRYKTDFVTKQRKLQNTDFATKNRLNFRFLQICHVEKSEISPKSSCGDN